MTHLADAIDRLAEATERQNNTLRRQEAREREAELAPYRSKAGQPRRMNVVTFALAVPGLIERYATQVPPEFWVIDGDGAVISCPCGATPTAIYGRPTPCECDRSYVYDGVLVRVAYKGEEQAQQAAPELVD